MTSVDLHVLNRRPIYFGQHNTPVNLVPKGYADTRIVDTMTKGVRAGATAIELDVTLDSEADLMASIRSRYNEPQPLARVIQELLDEIPSDTELHLELKTSDTVPNNFFPTKNKTLEKKLAEFIRANNLQDRIRLIGFSFVGARWLRKHYPDIRTDLGTSHPKTHLISKEASRRAHRQGIPVEPWVCNQPWHYEMKTILENIDFVDAIYTNLPGAVQAMLVGKEGRLGKRVQSVDSGLPELKLNTSETCPKGFSKKLFKTWQTEQARYQHLADRLRGHGLSEESLGEIQSFLLGVMGAPEGFSFSLSGDKFAEFYQAQPEKVQQRTDYILARFPMVLIDHFDGVLNALESDEDWQTTRFLLQGLLTHPDNTRMTLSTRPLGLVSSRLSETLDTKSAYWQALQQVTDYFEGVLDRSFDADQQFEREVEQSYFAAQVLYPFIYYSPLQYNASNKAVAFVENELPEILEDFKQQYPASGDVDENYFKLQEALINSVLLYLTRLDEVNRADTQVSDAVQVINHTPNNHLVPLLTPKQQRVMSAVADRQASTDNTLEFGILPMRQAVPEELRLAGFDDSLYQPKIAAENLLSSQLDVSRYFSALSKTRGVVGNIGWKLPGIKKLVLRVSPETALKQGIQQAQQQIENILDKRGWSERGGLKHSAFWQAYHVPTRLARVLPENQSANLLAFVSNQYLSALETMPEEQWAGYYQQVRQLVASNQPCLLQKISALSGNPLYSTETALDGENTIQKELEIRKAVLASQRQGEDFSTEQLREVAFEVNAQESRGSVLDTSALEGISVGHDNLPEHPDLIQLLTQP